MLLLRISRTWAVRRRLESVPLPVNDERTKTGWEPLERLTLIYGKLSGWSWDVISEAIAAIYNDQLQNGSYFRTHLAVSHQWAVHFQHLPDEERDIKFLIENGGQAIKPIEKYLKGLGKEQFQSGLSLEDEERRFRTEGLLPEAPSLPGETEKRALLPIRDCRVKKWDDLEVLVLWYGKLSNWTIDVIKQAIGKVYEGGKEFRTERACMAFWERHIARLPEEEQDLEALIREGGDLVREIQEYLNGVDAEKFRSHLLLFSSEEIESYQLQNFCEGFEAEFEPSWHEDYSGAEMDL